MGLRRYTTCCEGDVTGLSLTPDAPYAMRYTEYGWAVDDTRTGKTVKRGGGHVSLDEAVYILDSLATLLPGADVSYAVSRVEHCMSAIKHDHML